MCSNVELQLSRPIYSSRQCSELRVMNILIHIIYQFKGTSTLFFTNYGPVLRASQTFKYLFFFCCIYVIFFWSDKKTRFFSVFKKSKECVDSVFAMLQYWPIFLRCCGVQDPEKFHNIMFDMKLYDQNRAYQMLSKYGLVLFEIKYCQLAIIVFFRI